MSPEQEAAGLRVLVADDQDIVRAGLVTILDGRRGVTIVGEAADGLEAVRLARELRPDVCLLDIRMPGIDGVEATRRLAGPGVTDPIAVVVITTFDSDDTVLAALRAGARGFLLKDAGPDLLHEAVRAAASGDALVAPRVTARLLPRLVATAPGAPAARPPLVPLTPREKDVAAVVARGLTNQEIAAELHLSLGTVKFHLQSLLQKLPARNRVEIALWVHESGPGYGAASRT
ncbi:response regulator [Aquipuribacter nitratireducens]|uniref:Response regulator n=1 Tax=Aquipuribacter nitratireducens TaxID=650104 RepID=A0ABW0GSY1_9MICO